MQGVSGTETGPARQESLFRQLDEADIHVFGFQETRLRRASNAHDTRFWIFRSPATAHGHYGIMVGFARNKPIGRLHMGRDSQEVFIQHEDVAVIAADPRFLILRLKTFLFHAIVISAHAPHTGVADAEVAAWWQKLVDALPGRYNRWPRILLADANARIGMEPCHHIGPHQAEASNGKEKGFTQFVRSQGLFLPATFSSCHDGPGGTWLHSKGTWCRNDYIGLPGEWHYDSCRSWVSDDFEVGLAKEDHKAAIVLFTRQSHPHGAGRKLKPLKLRLSDIDPGAFPRLDPYSWHLDVHSHAQQLQSDLIAKLWHARAPPIRKPLKATMTDTTWSLVGQKRQARQHLQRHSCTQRRTLLAAWFACWRYLHVAQDAEGLIPLLASFDELLRQQDCILALAYQSFRSLGRQVVKCLRRDDIQFYTNLLQDCKEFLGPKDVKQLWQVVRRSLPKFLCPNISKGACKPHPCNSKAWKVSGYHTSAL